jgi:broad specificity phosphatase PhoE
VKADLPPLYFIRHGETDWNKNALVQGSINTDLNDKGIAQAIGLGRALSSLQPELQAYDFVASPQLRAQHTMRIICDLQPRDFTTVRPDARVRELEFGVWEGKPIWEMKASPIYPADLEGHYEWRPEGGESYVDGVARVDDFLRSLTKPTLIVAHGAVGRCIIGYVCGIPGPNLTHLPTPQGCYCELKDGKAQWFDAQHQPLQP